MTIPNPTDAPTLLTDADVLARVRELVGRACVDRQLWLMFVDGDGRQTPVVMPVSDIPHRPLPHLLGGLTAVLRGLRPRSRHRPRSGVGDPHPRAAWPGGAHPARPGVVGRARPHLPGRGDRPARGVPQQ